METLEPSRLTPAGREAPSRAAGPGRRMARCLGLMLLLTPAVLASPPTGPEIRMFFGLCDASAVVPAGRGAFWVGNDEENTLRLYDPAAGPWALEALPLDDFLEVDREHPEADIEGAADAGELVFWITSHGRNKDGKKRPSRRRFFATRWVEAPDGRGPRRLVPAGKPFKGLLEVLLEDPRYGGFGLREGSRRAPKEAGGLNIEGLAVAPGGALWIGFRNPIPRGRALIATLLNPREVTLSGALPRLGEPILLDLGGLGVRDLVRDGDHWWILAGEPDGGDEFRLFRWKGPGARPVPEALPIPADFSPEAIAPMGEGRLLLLSDDGTREIDGCRCKDLKDPGQRRFRALWWKPSD
ncbi:MAG: DUF3616 domain-containing protein [Verrucomicrobia bacterium]|nr:MAG: DUF3616 domain-containing protein [Verrucomicrobiota bacterium]